MALLILKDEMKHGISMKYGDDKAVADHVFLPLFNFSYHLLLDNH